MKLPLSSHVRRISERYAMRNLVVRFHDIIVLRRAAGERQKAALKEDVPPLGSLQKAIERVGAAFD